MSGGNASTFLTFLIILLVTSCSVTENEQVSSQTMAMMSNSTATSLISMPSSTVTHLPKTPTPAQSTPAATQYSTDKPTIPENDQEEHLLNFIHENGGCRLPCILGFIPGKTKVIDVQKTLLKYGIDLYFDHAEDGRNVYISYCLKEKKALCETIKVIERNGTIERIQIMGTGAYQGKKYNNLHDFQAVWLPYSPRNLLKKYGKPSRLLFRGNLYGRPDSIGYGLYFFYDDQDFLIAYNGVGQETGDVVRFCPEFIGKRDIFTIEIYAQSPEVRIPLEEELEYIQGYEDRLQPLEKITEMTVNDFFSLLTSNENTFCFDVPKIKLGQ